MAEKTVVLKRQPGERLGCRFLPAFGGCVLGPLRQGSPAARAGLEAFAGWQVTHVNDVRVTEPRQIRQIVQDAGEGIAFRLAPMSSPVGMPAFLSNHPALAAAVQRGEIDSSAPEHALESLYDIASQNGGAAWCTESVKQALEDWHRVRSKKPAPPVSEPDFSRGDIVEAVLTGAQHKELQGVRGRIRDIVDNRAHIKFFIDGTKLKSVKLSRLRLIEKADEGPGAKRRRTGPQDAQDSGSPASDPPQRAARTDLPQQRATEGANEGGSVSTDLPQQRATEGANEGGSVKKSQQRATEGANEGGSVEKSSDLPQRATEGANEGGSVKKSQQRATEGAWFSEEVSGPSRTARAGI
eukprot:TRINITY_DN4301_c0_g1_i2.p1 TRINITY_DN4301_c0_g1~~TRINITY_DN4301_c0_g1_i2.p1  ORF type:complete len:375 (+),score=8.66 TRINITY_DN4301_c0_g1_i2:64-1125(+)